MNLTRMLAVLRQDILHDRSARQSGNEDWLWSDESLIENINEAVRRFARLSWCIRDHESEATEVTLVAGQSEYVLHESVLGVLSARMTGDPHDLIRGGHAMVDTPRPPDWPWYDASNFSAWAPGKPLVYTTDEATTFDPDGSAGVVLLKVYPEPTAEYEDVVIRLRVVRLPLYDLAADNLGAIPEIPRDHHREVLDYAAALAMRIMDADAGSMAAAERFETLFNDNVKRARTAVLRKLRVPGSVSYRGSAFGWRK